jgi:RecA/RadA recombinase
LAGLEGVGKSYLASIISKNAQAQGFTVVYFDTESAIDPGFLERIGCNIDKLIYIQPPTVEFTMETIEEFLKNGERFLFIIDSIAMLPTKAESEGDYNPQSTMAVKPRVLTKAFAKLVQPIAKSDSALLILNQLKTNISSNPFDMLTTPYFMPAGFALKYASSLTIWLTGRKAKDSFVTDTNGYRIGSSCKAKLEKSRFGTQFRECTFKILWGGDTIAIDETEAWLEIMKVSDLVEKRGHSYVVQTEAGEQVFKNDDFPEKLLDASFRKRVDEIVEDFLITRFDQRSGNAKNYYNLDGEDEAKEETGVE